MSAHYSQAAAWRVLKAFADANSVALTTKAIGDAIQSQATATEISSARAWLWEHWGAYLTCEFQGWSPRGRKIYLYTISEQTLTWAQRRYT